MYEGDLRSFLSRERVMLTVLIWFTHLKQDEHLNHFLFFSLLPAQLAHWETHWEFIRFVMLCSVRTLGMENYFVSFIVGHWAQWSFIFHCWFRSHVVFTISSWSLCWKLRKLLVSLFRKIRLVDWLLRNITTDVEIG